MSERSGRHDAEAEEAVGRQAADRGADAAQAGPGEDATGTAEPEITELKEHVTELQDRVAELQDRWRRALADLDNLRKRVSRDTIRVRGEEEARAAAEWLPVLDNLERALDHADTDPASVAEGLRAIRDQALDVLDRLGFPRRDDTGTRFDPARHEAVGVLTQEGTPDGTVLHVVQPAYGDGERQLRPALVVVSKAE
ncbi:nucleotide exchange factor GrpE [Streptosporangium sp. NPDC051023]|uniref:nucleotide exchange factor GrpE n=1 Tax=Streptosporangium sp. NPDC051023 TaxID=3155410 RepID=UPI00344D9913